MWLRVLLFVRAGLAVAGVALFGAGVGLSLNEKSDSAVTFVLVYGLAGLCGLGVAAASVQLERRKEHQKVEPVAENVHAGRDLTAGDVPFDPDRFAAELVAIGEEGSALVADHYQESDYGSYTIWRDKTAVFIEAVFGGVERQRFLESRGPSTGTLRAVVEQRLANVRDLRDRPESWKPIVDTDGIDASIHRRRANTPAERIVFAGSNPPPPELSFGKARIDRWQPIHVQDEVGNPARVGVGRIIRIPVRNAQGAGEARDVHATVTFGDSDAMFYPAPVQAEWVGEQGSELTVRLPGNGAERLIDALLVLDGAYPYAYEWTRHSRAAGLRNSAIKSNQVDLGVKVTGSGSTPTIENVLDVLIEPGHAIRADWKHRGADDATNIAWWEDLR